MTTSGCTEIILNGTWQLHEEPISTLADAGPRIASQSGGWIDQPVPGDVRQGLMAAGRIQDPLVGMNAKEQYWIEDRSWWLRRTFEVSAGTLAADAVELEMHELDCGASIFVNGVHVGDHPTAFRPFVAKVKDLLREGENTLLVRLTHGLEHIREDDYKPLKGFQPTEDNRGRPERGDRRRPFVRKTQCVWGWDWAPRVATVAIAGDVKLRAIRQALVRDVQATLAPQTLAAAARQGGKLPRDVALNVTASVQWLDPYRSGRGSVKVALKDAAGKVVAKASAEQMLQSGLNYVTFELTVRNARLWWPNGVIPGDTIDADAAASRPASAKGSPDPQHLYSVEVELATPDASMKYPPVKYGIRHIELLVEKTFAFRVNGMVIFAKGGNWIPSDCLYARITDATYRTLVREAAAANFNMLRIWGGGRYEPASFYEACDRQGILVWHDFMLVCSPYPDHLESFRDEIAKEADFQMTRLRNHACMALWCGSNELLYCMGNVVAPGVECTSVTDRGTRLLGEVLPAAVRRNCPQTPYWYTSPSGGATPDSWEVGDCHFWSVPMQKDLEMRYEPAQFDSCDALFVSEYGYPGPLCRESTLQYLGGSKAYDRDERGVWMHHMNTFDQGALDLGIRKHYIDPLKATLDEYLFFGGIMQSLMYGYTLESLRNKPRCHGSLFWMYNDTWGEVGWTIIDHYLRRKIAYYGVKRAFAPQRLILRNAGGKIAVTLANDQAKAVRGSVEFGYVSLDGKVRKVRSKTFVAAGMKRTVVASFPKGSFDELTGLWFARLVGRDDIAPALLRTVDFRKIHVTQPALSLSVKPLAAGRYAVTVASDVYAHAVHLELPAGSVPGDNYLDLLPGESRTIVVASAARLTAANVTVKSAYDAMHERPEFWPRVAATVPAEDRKTADIASLSNPLTA